MSGFPPGFTGKPANRQKGLSIVPSKELRVTVSQEDYQRVADYVSSKRKWRRVGDFLRFAVFTVMERNPTGRHDKDRSDHGAERTEASGANL